MTQEEIKSRNTALATWMGWVYNPAEQCWQYSDGTGWLAPPDPPFHEDMNLLMRAFQKLVSSGVDIHVVNREGGKYACNTSGYIAGAPRDTVQEAIFTTIFYHVMMTREAV